MKKKRDRRIRTPRTTYKPKMPLKADAPGGSTYGQTYKDTIKRKGSN